MRPARLSDKPVLAIDSALGGCVAAVVMPDGTAYGDSMVTEREQAAKLVPLVQEVMREAKIDFPQLGLIVTTTGPGSFTGLRISLSSARSLGLALDLPVHGVSTFEAMYHSCAPLGDALVVLESKRADFYVQSFDALGKGSAPECLLSDAIKANTICGDAAHRLKIEGVESDYIERVLVDPIVLARLGLAQFTQSGHKADKPEPFYMRGADVSVSTKSKREIDINSY